MLARITMDLSFFVSPRTHLGSLADSRRSFPERISGHGPLSRLIDQAKQGWFYWIGLVNGMAVDAAGNQYVADSNNNRIQVFDASGNLLRKWGAAGSGDGQFDLPIDIAVGPGGTVYVLDRLNHRVQKFDTAGNFLGKWGSAGSGDTEFDLPGGIVAGPLGDILVAEQAGRIKQFDGNGGFLTAWGTYGTSNGQFDAPVGMAFDGSNNLYIADVNNNRIQKFGPQVVATLPTTWGRLKALWR